jgi:hypothetical protein
MAGPLWTVAPMTMDAGSFVRGGFGFTVKTLHTPGSPMIFSADRVLILAHHHAGTSIFGTMLGSLASVMTVQQHCRLLPQSGTQAERRTVHNVNYEKIEDHNVEGER